MTRPVTSFGVVSVASVDRYLAIRLGVHVCIKLSFVLRSFPEVVALVGYLRTPLQLAKSVAQISVVPHVVEASKSVTTPSVVRSADPIDAQVTLPTKARFRTHHNSASRRTHTRRTVGCLAAFQLRGSGAVGLPGGTAGRGPCAMAPASWCVLQRTWKAQCVTVMPMDQR
jgi:hypothetical protein